MNATNAIPPGLRDLLAKLEFFGMIERGKKPCMNDMTFVDARSWYGVYYRSTAGEGRKNMIFQINAIIDDAIKAIMEYQNTEFLPLIVNALSKASRGLSNLTSTYHKRPDTVIQIQVCLMNINLQLDKYKHLINGHPSQIQSVNKMNQKHAQHQSHHQLHQLHQLHHHLQPHLQSILPHPHPHPALKLDPEAETKAETKAEPEAEPEPDADAESQHEEDAEMNLDD